MKSMTAFARSGFSIAGTDYSLEIRTVNSRHLDLKLRLPWGDAVVERRVAAELRGRLGRGRVDLTVVETGERSIGPLSANAQVAEELASVLRELAAAMKVELSIAAALVPQQPELVSSSRPTLDSETIWGGGLAEALSKALSSLIAMRMTEGAATAEHLSQLVGQLEALYGSLEQRTADFPQRTHARLIERLESLGIPGEGREAIDPGRLAQEVAVIADRSDVTEELSRLRSHIAQFKQIVEEDGQIGRRLEFMLQELSREVNTTGSKAADSEVTRLVVEAKGVLERLREQVQNVE